MKAPTALETLHWAQHTLEDFYGARTCLDVRDFVRTLPDFEQLGRLHVEQDVIRGDIDLALFFDRDIFAAWPGHHAHRAQHAHRAASVICEEVSHFVYLGFNHRRQRNICSIELEVQSEIDRIVLAFHPEAPLRITEHRATLLTELCDKPHTSADKVDYEQARRWAAQLLSTLAGGNPSAWGANERAVLRDFFHRDLAEKLHLIRSSER